MAFNHELKTSFNCNFKIVILRNSEVTLSDKHNHQPQHGYGGDNHEYHSPVPSLQLITYYLNFLYGFLNFFRVRPHTIIIFTIDPWPCENN